MASSEIPVDACCFHGQQAAEKYLKAYLVSRQINFPKIHDLQALLNLCISVNSSFNEITEPAIRLSDYAIAPRYPDTFDDLTLSDAKDAYEDAITIKDFVLNNFFG